MRLAEQRREGGLANRVADGPAQFELVSDSVTAYLTSFWAVRQDLRCGEMMALERADVRPLPLVFPVPPNGGVDFCLQWALPAVIIRYESV